MSTKLEDARRVIAEGVAAIISGNEILAEVAREAEAPAGGDPATNRKAFFAVLRASGLFGRTFTQGQVSGINLTLEHSADLPPAWRAYILGTEFHETGATMEAVEEIGKGRGKPYGRPGRNGGQIPYGRGEVQLTHDENYERADRELGLGGALIADYSKALDPIISTRIMILGMMDGWFTGKRLRDYLPTVATLPQFVAARRIVNGTDKALLIAGHAMTFQAALFAAERPEDLIS